MLVALAVSTFMFQNLVEVSKQGEQIVVAIYTYTHLHDVCSCKLGALMANIN